MRRLLPAAGADGAAAALPISPAEAAAGTRPRPPGRPWISLCMVSSIDGTTSVGGGSRGLGSTTDTAMLSALRNVAELIVVGAGTVRAEGYGPPRRAGQRIAVVTNRADLDFSSALFQSGAGLLIMPEDGPDVPVEAIRAGTGVVDLAAACARLDVGVIQAEGGATLNAALADADLIDEINLTIAPLVVGGSGPRLVDGARERRRDMRLVQLLEDDGYLFARWQR